MFYLFSCWLRLCFYVITILILTFPCLKNIRILGSTTTARPIKRLMSYMISPSVDFRLPLGMYLLYHMLNHVSIPYLVLSELEFPLVQRYVLILTHISQNVNTSLENFFDNVIARFIKLSTKSFIGVKVTTTNHVYQLFTKSAQKNYTIL